MISDASDSIRPRAEEEPPHAPELEQRVGGKTATELMADAAHMFWGVVANVSEGDWSKQSPEWQAAAARARDHYHQALDAHVDSQKAQVST